MAYLAFHVLGGPEVAVFSNYGMWLFLSVGAVSLFGIFIPIVTFVESRRKEREAFYKAETFRRLAESTTDSAKSAVEMLREEGRQEQIKKREGMKIGGVITVAVGVALCIFLRAMTGREPDSPWLCGLIPAFVGAAMLVYVFFMAAPIEKL